MVGLEEGLFLLLEDLPLEFLDFLVSEKKSIVERTSERVIHKLFNPQSDIKQFEVR